MVRYNAIVNQGNNETPVTIDAEDMVNAIEMLEARYGKGSVSDIKPHDKSDNKYNWVPTIKTENEQLVRKRIFRKLRHATGKVPFMDDVVAAYYCAIDPNTPKKIKATLWSALAYFVLPFDTLPDFIPFVGYSDDVAALATAIGIAASHVKEDHYLAAYIWFDNEEKAFEILKKKLVQLKSDLFRSKIEIVELSGEDEFQTLMDELVKLQKDFDHLSSMTGRAKEVNLEINNFAEKLNSYINEI